MPLLVQQLMLRIGLGLAAIATAGTGMLLGVGGRLEAILFLIWELVRAGGERLIRRVQGDTKQRCRVRDGEIEEDAPSID